MKIDKNYLKLLIRESTLKIIKEYPGGNPKHKFGPEEGGGTYSSGSAQVAQDKRELAKLLKKEKGIPKEIIKSLAEIGIGFTSAGWVIDAKDLAVAVDEFDGDLKSFGGIGVAMFGFVPGLGDLVKTLFKIKKTEKVLDTGDELTSAANKAFDKAKKVDKGPNIKGNTSSTKKKLKKKKKDYKKIPGRPRVLHRKLANSKHYRTGKALTPDNIIDVDNIVPFAKVEGRDIYIIEDGLGARRAWYRSTGTGGMTKKGEFAEMEGFGNGHPALFPGTGIDHANVGWHVKTEATKIPPSGTVEQAIKKKLESLPKDKLPEPPSWGPIDTTRKCKGINKLLQQYGVDTVIADMTVGWLQSPRQDLYVLAKIMSQLPSYKYLTG